MTMQNSNVNNILEWLPLVIRENSIEGHQKQSNLFEEILKWDARVCSQHYDNIVHCIEQCLMDVEYTASRIVIYTFSLNSIVSVSNTPQRFILFTEKISPKISFLFQRDVNMILNYTNGGNVDGTEIEQILQCMGFCVSIFQNFVTFLMQREVFPTIFLAPLKTFFVNFMDLCHTSFTSLRDCMKNFPKHEGNDAIFNVQPIYDSVSKMFCDITLIFTTNPHTQPFLAISSGNIKDDHTLTAERNQLLFICDKLLKISPIIPLKVVNLCWKSIRDIAVNIHHQLTNFLNVTPFIEEILQKLNFHVKLCIQYFPNTTDPTEQTETTLKKAITHLRFFIPILKPFLPLYRHVITDDTFKNLVEFLIKARSLCPPNIHCQKLSKERNDEIPKLTELIESVIRSLVNDIGKFESQKMDIIVSYLNPSSLSNLYSIGKLEILLSILDSLDSWDQNHPIRPNLVLTLNWILDFIVLCFSDVVSSSMLKKIYNVLCKYCVSEWEVDGVAMEIEKILLHCFGHPHPLCNYLGVELWEFIVRTTPDNDLRMRYLKIVTELILSFNDKPYSPTEGFELPHQMLISLDRVMSIFPQSQKEYIYQTLVCGQEQDSPPSLLGKTSSALFFLHVNPSCLGQNLLPDITTEIMSYSLKKMAETYQGSFEVDSLTPYICCARGLVGRNEVNEHVIKSHRNKLIQLATDLLDKKEIQSNTLVLIEIIDLLGVLAHFLSLPLLSKTLILLLQFITSTPNVRVAIADFIGKLINFDINEPHNSSAALNMFQLISNIFNGLFSDDDWVVLSSALYNLSIFMKYTKFQVFTTSYPGPENKIQLIQSYLFNSIGQGLNFSEIAMLEYQAKILEEHTTKELQKRKRFKVENDTPKNDIPQNNIIVITNSTTQPDHNNPANHNYNIVNNNNNNHNNINNNNINNSNNHNITTPHMNGNNRTQVSFQNNHFPTNTDSEKVRRGLHLIGQGLDCLKEVAQWNIREIGLQKDEFARLGKRFFELEDLLTQTQM